jgi:8-oxo-dGTP pyrophosphatase MutT (NUDIX family)
MQGCHAGWCGPIAYHGGHATITGEMWRMALEMTASRGPQTMISVGIAGTLFMYRAAGICIADGRVLLCRTPGFPFWQLPGGNVHTGESSFDALRRELFEEIGVAPAIERLVYVVEHFLDAADQHLQEIGLYFEISLPEGSPPLAWSEPVIRAGAGNGEAYEWAWHPLDQLDAIELLPPQLKAHLRRLPPHPEHVIARKSI